MVRDARFYFWCFSTLCSLVAFASLCFAQSGVIRDINQVARELHVIQSCATTTHTFLFADDGVSGEELWKLSPEAESASLLKDILPGAAGSLSEGKCLIQNNQAYFLGEGDQEVPAIWTSDGTEFGTRELISFDNSQGFSPLALLDGGQGLYIALRKYGFTKTTSQIWYYDLASSLLTLMREFPEVSSFRDDTYAVLGSTLIFSSYDTINGYELWKSDGTPQGTTLVKDISLGNSSSFPDHLYEFAGKVYFAADDGIHGVELWVTDGTTAGTSLFIDLHDSWGSFPKNLMELNGSLVFTAHSSTTNGALWKSDGTPIGTVEIETTNDDGFYSADELFRAGDLIYFEARNSQGTEYWRTDGTNQGTFMISDINPGSSSSVYCSSSDYNRASFQEEFYFSANDGEHGCELWKSDGTKTGTQLLVDALPGSRYSYPDNITPTSKVLFFRAREDSSSRSARQWRSTGESAGTVRDTLFESGATYDSRPQIMGQVGRYTIFQANDGIHGKELWSSDGTESGTVMLADFTPGRDSTNFRPRAYDTNDSMLLFFIATDYDGDSWNYELWRSSGTTSDTELVFQRRSSGSTTANFLVQAGGQFFFPFCDADLTGCELWKSDGTPSGTSIARDIRPGTDSSSPRVLGVLNDVFHFSAYSEGFGTELWKSDGTALGTVMVKDIEEGSASSSPNLFIAANGVAYFRANTNDEGRELWFTDGTSDGTYLVSDIVPGPDSIEFAPVGILGSNLLFRVRRTSSLYDLWVSDGTDQGTGLLKDFELAEKTFISDASNFQGELYFRVGADWRHAYDLWKSDGTPGGTVRVYDVQGDVRGVSEVFALPNELYFSADTGQGTELYQLEQSSELALALDITPGKTGAFPQQVVELGSSVLFSADHVVFGDELWTLEPSECFGQDNGLNSCNCVSPDSDLDGTLDCQDLCPLHADKVAPDQCGCGKAEDTSICEAQQDDSGALETVTPPAPTIRVKRRKVIVSMTPREGVMYELTYRKILPRSGETKKGKRGRKKVKVKTVVTDSSEVRFRRTPRKHRIKASYRYLALDTENVGSQESPTAKKRAKRRKSRKR